MWALDAEDVDVADVACAVMNEESSTWLVMET